MRGRERLGLRVHGDDVSEYQYHQGDALYAEQPIFRVQIRHVFLASETDTSVVLELTPKASCGKSSSSGSSSYKDPNNANVSIGFCDTKRKRNSTLSRYPFATHSSVSETISLNTDRPGESAMKGSYFESYSMRIRQGPSQRGISIPASTLQQ